MDIKSIYFHQRGFPVFDHAPRPEPPSRPVAKWREFPEGTYEAGWGKADFAYDVERPRHPVYLQSFSVRENLVSNGEYVEFIEDGGYLRPELWLSDGWEWVQRHNISAPLYWTSPGRMFTLHGELPRLEHEPVAHVSYFEADAFARWKKGRLPTEYEWEVAFANYPQQPLWQWTQSAFLPYPGYRPFANAFSEYNGKFMSGQMVLRGGCALTPRGHYRPTYRNFYYPEMRWQFSGIRLCAS